MGSNIASTKDGASCDGLVARRRVGSAWKDSESILISPDDADSSRDWKTVFQYSYRRKDRARSYGRNDIAMWEPKGEHLSTP